MTSVGADSQRGVLATPPADPSLAVAIVDRPRPPQPASLDSIPRLAAGIAGALMIAVGTVALAVHVTAATWARRWLAYPFTGIPARPIDAAGIFVHNLRALTAIAGLLLIAQSPFWGAPRNLPGRVHRILRRGGEALLAGAVVTNTVVIGAALGAYGARMIRAALPQGPFELAAYTLALALYMRGRDRPLELRATAIVGACSVIALALAAGLETYVNV